MVSALAFTAGRMLAFFMGICGFPMRFGSLFVVLSCFVGDRV